MGALRPSYVRWQTWLGTVPAATLPTAGPAVTLSSTSSASPTFTSPVVAANTGLTFQLMVNDGMVDSAPDTVDITVLQVFQGVTPVDLENLVFTLADGVAF